MKKELTYNEAYTQLEKIVAAIEDEEIQLDQLAEKVEVAQELITFCEQNLRKVEAVVNKQLKEGEQ